MMITVNLPRVLFTDQNIEVARYGELVVTARRYPNGIEALTLANSRGYIELLPFMGQIIWDANFDGKSLRMQNMFSKPQVATQIVDTYGCFVFHSGLLSAGCPAPEDTHPLHGEFPTATMDEAILEISDQGIRAVSTYEYVQGFGHHYEAKPSVFLGPQTALFDIDLQVTNLSKYQVMPLQYMCHMNYAFVPGAKLLSNLPEDAFQLRRSVPDHVTPTPQWTRINQEILAGEFDSNSLVGAEAFDPEIVYFADNLPQYVGRAEFVMEAPDGTKYSVAFDTVDFPVATRWILHNEDQKVAAFVLPGTSRPEGRLAAKKAGTLIELGAGETKRFSVRTGIKE
ncbi:MAG: aldose 1-epimerase family protein [Actinomycetaceae bacterium]|nr:aldose 1-epimerase family protein [Actinomycetaceae bacterium]